MGNTLQLSAQVKAAMATLAELERGREALDRHLENLLQTERDARGRFAQLESEAGGAHSRIGDLLAEAQDVLLTAEEERRNSLDASRARIDLAVQAQVASIEAVKSSLDESVRKAVEQSRTLLVGAHNEVAAAERERDAALARMHERISEALRVEIQALAKDRKRIEQLEQDCRARSNDQSLLGGQLDNVATKVAILEDGVERARLAGEKSVAEQRSYIDATIQASSAARIELERHMREGELALRERLNHVERRNEVLMIQAESSHRLAWIGLGVAVLAVVSAIAGLVMR